MTATTTDAPPPDVPPRPSGGRLPLVLALWTAVLVAGFALVVVFGRPIEDPVSDLSAAYEPPTPVTEAVARDSAATIVRLQFPEFAGFEPAVERHDDFGIPRWVVVYADPGGAAGVRVSITEAQGTVEVSAFP